MKKIIVSIVIISQLLAISMVSVNVFGNEGETTDSEIADSYSHVIPFANIYVDDDNIAGPWDGTYHRTLWIFGQGSPGFSH